MAEPLDESRFERIDAVIEEAAARLRRGEAVDADEILAAHPELLPELKAVLPGALRLERVAQEPVLEAASEGQPRRIGRYRVVREVGRGGMGVVYEAVDDELGRHVAVKWIAAHIAGDERYLERFRREAQAAAKLSHKGVVPVFEVGEHGGRPFFAMQLVEGHGLDALLAELAGASGFRAGDRARAAAELAGSPPLGREYHRRVARLGLQVARTLDAAHGQGILHRDIKPANILVDPEGRAFVADFGLARVGESGDVTREGDLVGTLRYMAPEQLQGEADPRTDVYALGLVLYELLTLQPAFPGDSRRTLVHDALYRRPRRIRSLRPEVPGDLERITSKAIAKLPAERYRSAANLAADLDAFLQGRPISARMPGLRYLLRLAVARNRPLAGVLGLALLFALVAIPAYVLQLRATNRTEGRLAYLGNLSGAAASMRAGDAVGARRRLESCSQDLRGWEWEHLAARLDQSLGTLSRLPTSIKNLDLGPEGLVVTRAGDVDRFRGGSWDRPIEPPAGVGRWPLVKAWKSAEGWRALDAEGVLWAAPDEPSARTSGLRVLGGKSGGQLICYDLSPDRSVLGVVYFNGRLELLDAVSGDILAAIPAETDPPRAIAVTAAGQRVFLVTTSGALARWNPGEPEPQVLYRAPAPLRSLAVSRDGAHVAISGLERSILVLETLGATVQSTLVGHTEEVTDMLFGPGNQLFSCSHDSTIRVWDLQRGECLRTLQGHARAVVTMAFDLAGQRLFSGSRGGVVKEWDVNSTGGFASLTGHVRDVGALCLSPSGAQAATGDRAGLIRLTDLASERLDGLLLGHHQAIASLAYGQAGRSLVSTGYDRQVIAWDLERASERWRFELPGPGLALATAGDRLWVGTREGALVALALDDGRVLARGKVTGEATLRCMARSPDGRLLLVGQSDGALQVHRASDLRFMETLGAHQAQVESIAFGPAGESYVTAGADGAVSRWSYPGNQLLYRWLLESDGSPRESDALTDARFSPDGQRIAVASHSGLVRLLVADSGDPLLDLPGHGQWVRRVVFTPDGKQLVSTASDSRVNLWDQRSARERHRARAHRLAQEAEARAWLTEQLGGPLNSLAASSRARRLEARPPLANALIHQFTAEHLLEYWADTVLRDPGRAPEASVYLQQLELQFANQPGPPMLAAVVALAKGDLELAASRLRLARRRWISPEASPWLDCLEWRVGVLQGAGETPVPADPRPGDPAVNAVRRALVQDWMERWRDPGSAR